jgi:Cu-Zn family superoxide dismutase
MKPLMIAAAAGAFAVTAQAASLSIPMNAVSESGKGAPIGSVTVETSRYGLVFRPQLSGLAPGIHGFHIHANGSCDPAMKDGKPSAAEAAGGHWDPQKTGRHGEPWGDGHLGDLPALLVTDDGKATQPVLAPRLEDLDALKGHALMIHKGGDNHSDHPQPVGGGGARIACGVIQ